MRCGRSERAGDLKASNSDSYFVEWLIVHDWSEFSILLFNIEGGVSIRSVAFQDVSFSQVFFQVFLLNVQFCGGERKYFAINHVQGIQFQPNVMVPRSIWGKSLCFF